MLKKLYAMKNKKGFTLVELMVVVAILGILVAVAVPVYNNVTEKAAVQTVQANVRTLESAITQMEAVTGKKVASVTTGSVTGDTAVTGAADGDGKLADYIKTNIFTDHKGFTGTIAYTYDATAHAVTATTTGPNYTITSSTSTKNT